MTEIWLVQEVSQSERAVSAKLPIPSDRYWLQSYNEGPDASFPLWNRISPIIVIRITENLEVSPPSAPYLTFYCRGCWRMNPWKLVLEIRGIWICRFTYGNWGFPPRGRGRRFSEILSSKLLVQQPLAEKSFNGKANFVGNF